MSYCRFSEGDVYAYACDGGVQFWVTGKTLDRLCNTYDAAYQYAKYLRDEGFDVPSHAIEALRADALEEASHGDGSAVAELVSENAKLREQVTRLRDDWESERDYADQMEAKEKRAVSENAKLRELLTDMLIDPRDYCAKYGIDYDGWDSANDDIDRRLRELGIEVD